MCPKVIVRLKAVISICPAGQALLSFTKKKVIKETGEKVYFASGGSPERPLSFKERGKEMLVFTATTKNK